MLAEAKKKVDNNTASARICENITERRCVVSSTAHIKKV